MANFRGLVVACARPGDELCNIAGPACPYTLPIAGRSLISHSIRSLVAAGVSEILVVASAEIFEEIAAAVGDPGIPIHYAIHPAAECESVALEAARDELGPGPVLAHLADGLIPDGFGDVQPGDNRIFAFGNRVVAAALEELPADPPGLTLAHAAGDAERVDVENGWKYDGTVDGVLEANSVALDQLKRGRIGADLSHASVQGRVQIHPTAVLDGAKLRGPVYIGPGARVGETYVGPYTSISGGATLEGVEIENSIVMAGATIRYPGRRLEASIVGEGAHVGRDFTLPSALRVRVGRGADIQLS